MNKVYKVIWCAATQTFVAVSELAKGQGKGATGSAGSPVNGRCWQVFSGLKLSLLSVAIMLATGANAADRLISDDTGDSWRIPNALNDANLKLLGADGISTTMTGNGTNNTLTIGINTTSTEFQAAVAAATKTHFHVNDATPTQPVGDATTNLGSVDSKSGATGAYAIAAGVKAKAQAKGSIAIGGNSLVNTENTIILGNSINTKADGMAIGNTVANSVYLGSNSQATAGSGLINDTTEESTLHNTTSEGLAGATTTAGDKGTVDKSRIGGKVSGFEVSDFAGATAHGVVTVGAAGSERRIQNLAAGEISKTSTDAINGSQLYRVAEELDRKNYFHVNGTGKEQFGSGAVADSNLDRVDGFGGASGIDALAAGFYAQALCTRQKQRKRANILV